MGRARGGEGRRTKEKGKEGEWGRRKVGRGKGRNKCGEGLKQKDGEGGGKRIPQGGGGRKRRA